MMRKLMMMPLLIVMLVACQSKTAEETVEKETNEQVDKNNSEEEKAVDLSLYDEIIEDYEKLTEMSLEEAEDTSFEYVKNGALYYFYDSDVYEGVSTTYYDLNGDGVDELIVTLRFKLDIESYSLIDLYTIVDDEPVSIFTDEMSLGAMYKRSGYYLLRNGNLIYTTASGAGEKYGDIYELNEKSMKYDKTYVVSQTEGNFEKIEKELENSIDFTEFEWKNVGKEKERSTYDKFMLGDYTALEGKWKNGHEGSQVTIKGNELTSINGDKSTLDFSDEHSDETSYVFDLSVEGENQFPPLLTFYPKNIEIKLGKPVLPSDTKQDRFTITQAGAPGEKDVYYKIK